MDSFNPLEARKLVKTGCVLGAAFGLTHFWLPLWLAVIVGTMAAYLYDRFEFSVETIINTVTAPGTVIIGQVADWFGKPKPFVHASAVIMVVPLTLFWQARVPEIFNALHAILAGLVILTTSLTVIYIAAVVLYSLAFVGARLERSYWRPFTTIPNNKQNSHAKKLKVRHYFEREKNYRNIWCFIFQGAASVALLIVGIYGAIVYSLETELNVFDNISFVATCMLFGATLARLARKPLLRWLA